MSRLYSNLKFLRFAGQLDAWRTGTIRAPVHVRIKPINRCNHNCWYCAYRMDNLQLGESMDESDALPKDKMFEIVADLIAMGVRAVTFSGGGEPLLYKPLPEVVTRLAAGGIRVASLTNGVNFRGRMADAFAAYGSWVRVSIDAWNDASYRAARGAREGEFDAVIDNMRRFVARGSGCTLGVSFIVGEANAPHIYEICALLKDIGVDHVKLSGAIVANDPVSVNRYHRRFRGVADVQIDKARALADDRFDVLDHYHDLDARFEKSYSFCPFLQYLTVIGADATVYACQDKAYTDGGALGSIKDRSFREFWFSEDNRARIYGMNPSVSCRHHCVAHAKNTVIVDFLALDSEHEAFV